MIFKDKHAGEQFLLGVNYWPASSALNMWTEWNPVEIQDDVKRMKELGMNCCRPFLFLPAFMDNPEFINPLMMERLHFFLQQCEEQNLFTLLTFIVGHMSGEDWQVSWCQGNNFIADPEAIEITKRYIRSVVKEVKSYPRIIGWLLSNELPNYIGSQKSKDVELWVKNIIETIKTEDPTRPISIGDGAWSPEITSEPSGFLLRKLNQYQDFVGLHYYPHGMSSWHHSFTTAFRLRMAKAWNRPVIVEEFGAPTTLCSEENQANYYREVFYSALINGAEGILSWCLSDFDFENKRPYSHHTFEERFGVIKTDKSLKPAALEFAPFSKLVAELIRGEYRKMEQPAGLLIPSNYYYEYPYPYQPVFKDWYTLYLETFSILKRSGIDIEMIFEPAQELENDAQYSHELRLNPREVPLLFIPRMKVMTKPMRIRLDTYIRDGGTVYFSFANDSWVLDWHKLAGIEMDCKFGVPDFFEAEYFDVICEEDWGEFKSGQSYQIPLQLTDPEYSYCPVLNISSRVILKDRSDTPLLVKHAYGKGIVYFCTFPIEMLALASQIDDWKRMIGKIYRAIYHSTYPDHLFSVDGDGLEMGVWEKDSCYWVIIFNHAWIGQKGLLSIGLSGWKIENATIPYRQVGRNIVEFSLDQKSVCHLTFSKH